MLRYKKTLASLLLLSLITTSAHGVQWRRRMRQTAEVGACVAGGAILALCTALAIIRLTLINNKRNRLTREQNLILDQIRSRADRLEIQYGHEISNEAQKFGESYEMLNEWARLTVYLSEESRQLYILQCERLDYESKIQSCNEQHDRRIKELQEEHGRKSVGQHDRILTLQQRIKCLEGVISQRENAKTAEDDMQGAGPSSTHETTNQDAGKLPIHEEIVRVCQYLKNIDTWFDRLLGQLEGSSSKKKRKGFLRRKKPVGMPQELSDLLDEYCAWRLEFVPLINEHLLDTCTICIEPMDEEANVQTLPCGHAYCGGCLYDYETRDLDYGTNIVRYSCPICRAEYTPVEFEHQLG